MNAMNGIRGNEFIHEILPTALICQTKAPKVLMQSDMPLGLHSRTMQGTVINSIQADELHAHYRTVPKHKVCAAL